MSTLLWKYYFENDVESFRHILARATYNASHSSRSGGARGGSSGLSSSPGNTLGTSSTLTSKSRKQAEFNSSNTLHPHTDPKSLANVTLSRADVNWRDSYGVTLLHHIASSTSDNASQFADALLQLQILDLYVQDEESGWTALHRALYFGNITIARALMDRDLRNAKGQTAIATTHNAGGLIKIKDREGNSPFDVYGASIRDRLIRHTSNIPLLPRTLDEEENDAAQGVSGDAEDNDDASSRIVQPRTRIDGDEMFAFGSNKNFTLGFGDEDDRQYPERVYLKRPEHLLRRFYEEYQSQQPRFEASDSGHAYKSPIKINQIPALIQYRPFIIQDVQLSKLHSAVLTTDSEANLYMCGFGSGGRLGTGDEATRFGLVSVHGGGLMGKKVTHIALGQNHSIAISSEGETYTWGSNAFGQLGYASASSGIRDEEPLQLLPRQVFGPLKRELVVGATASRAHSVVFTSSSLYTFGKNEGQLGLVDSDARSLAVQSTPRKVAASLFSSSITSVSAIDKATICLLENHDVWVFANYGYTKISFPLEAFSNYFLNSVWASRGQNSENHICKITSGGDTICAMSSMGDVFTLHVGQKIEASNASSSTTNPSKIRGALSQPQRVWSLKKGHMAVRDVDVIQDGSIVICTESGSVWRRVRRAKIKDASAAGLAEYKAKDYKFSRVPGLTRVAAVRSNAFGAYAAVRRDCDVLKTQVDVENITLWNDVYPLLPLHGFAAENSDTENPEPRFWKPSQPNNVATIRKAVLTATDIEEDVASFLVDEGISNSRDYDLRIGSTVSNVRIPVHEFVFAGRSEFMRKAFADFRRFYFFTVPDIMIMEYDKEGRTLVLFEGADFITILNLVLYMYTDSVVDVWTHARHVPASAFRYRQARTELMKIAFHLEMRKLEQAVRVMTQPPKTLHNDFASAIHQPTYFDNGDVEVELAGQSMKVHSALMCQRCPFFEGLFQGRAAGLWLSSRREQTQEPQETIKVDLKHVEPQIFQLVLQHIYADIDESMFDNVVIADFDAFLDLIMEVMSVANELMLDRLVQCCQKILGRFVNTRNVCQLLNGVAPCSVTEFKDAALEYICLNLEGLLENDLLGELDSGLMLELDEVVRQNQLNCLPIAKSGRAEAELIESHPELIGLIERGKRSKIDSVSLQTRLHEREAKSVGGSKAKAAFLEDFDQSPASPKMRPRSSRHRTGQSKSPLLRAKDSAADLIFAMDKGIDSDPDESSTRVPSRPRRQAGRSSEPALPPSSLPLDDPLGHDEGAHSLGADDLLATSASPSSYGNRTQQDLQQRPPSSGNSAVWASPNIGTPRLEMKDIMAQASSNRVSNISSALSLQGKSQESLSIGMPGKLSQRERKKQQQQQAQISQSPAAPSPIAASEPLPKDKPASPWQVASRGPKVSLKDVLGSESSKSPPPSKKPSIARSPSPMTLRQTLSGKTPASQRSVSGPAQSSTTPQKRTVSYPNPTQPPPMLPSPVSRPASITNHTLIQSIRHTPAAVEPSLQLSMADILSQQQTEKEIIKEAAAKRSLQEIQEEQAFQEWWDQESLKARQEEAAKPAVRGIRLGRGKASRGRGRGRGSGSGNFSGRGGVGAGEDGSGTGNASGRGERKFREREGAYGRGRGEGR